MRIHGGRTSKGDLFFSLLAPKYPSFIFVEARAKLKPDAAGKHLFTARGLDPN